MGSSGMPTALQLPKLSEVHLDLRISPAELRARAESAAKVAQLQETWRQRRFHRLVGDPSTQTALKKWLQRARQRIQQRREQENAARAAELAAVQATTHQASCSRVYAEQRAMSRQASLTPPLWSDTVEAWGCSTQQQQAASELHNLWLHTEVCYWGSTKLLQLQAIQRLLQERGAAGTLGQSCPVCRVAQLWADDWAYRQQQQEQALQAQARQQEENQQGLAGTSVVAGAGGPGTVLSVSAAEFLPHVQQHTHRQSVEKFQVSSVLQHSLGCTGLQQPLTSTAPYDAQHWQSAWHAGWRTVRAPLLSPQYSRLAASLWVCRCCMLCSRMTMSVTPPAGTIAVCPLGMIASKSFTLY